ncbi:MAG: bifunctional phosphoglucose/phosphomannose isomerase [Candidatus Saccharibacteria bacterium]|nr:bifunctional phosphoglucose/phosphomannose isomerase [Candidatus Saccharibacteria bacterium]
MFGHNDDQQQDNSQGTGPVDDGFVAPPPPPPANDFNPALPGPDTHFGGPGPMPSPSAPISVPSFPSSPVSHDDPQVPDPTDLDDDHQEPVSASTNDLLDIKQQALNQLSPLVGHLEQSPEEKFRTTMMMIQASDNQDLVKDAYAAAQEIKDEKAKAQALLDIVNEINYFTQHHQA